MPSCRTRLETTLIRSCWLGITLVLLAGVERSYFSRNGRPRQFGTETAGSRKPHSLGRERWKSKQASSAKADSDNACSGRVVNDLFARASRIACHRRGSARNRRRAASLAGRRAHFGLWLSLVERCVRDAEAVGSNPTSPILSRHPRHSIVSGEKHYARPRSAKISVEFIFPFTATSQVRRVR